MVFLLIFPSWFLDSARPWLLGDLFVLEGHVAETMMCGEEDFEALVAIS